MLSTRRYMLLALCVADLSPHAQGEVIALGDLPGGNFTSRAFGVSANGSVVVGNSNSALSPEAFRWSASGGLQGLGTLTGGTSSGSTGTSANGAVVVGFSTSSSGLQAFRWTQAGGMQGLGDLPGGIFQSQALDTSADGSVVVGRSSSVNGADEAFRWTSAGGMQGLGDLPGGSFSSRAYAITADGSVIVGGGASANGNEAFRWTAAGGMQGLGDLAGGSFSSEAYEVSADGSVAVGFSSSGNGIEAFRWSATNGMQGLGDLTGGSFQSLALGISADGNVVVGQGNSANGNEAFRWTQATGMQSLAAWLEDGGISSSDWQFSSAADISADGKTIVGNGLRNGNTEAFVARANALVSLNELGSSLASSGQALSGSLRSLDTLINGAHSRPLSRRVETGQSTAWLAGDWGRDDHGKRSGDLGLAELGGGYNFGPAQLNLAVGQLWSDQQQSQGSSLDARSNYLLVETIVPLSQAHGLWATFGGQLAWGENQIKRGYLNGDRADHSDASPDTQSYSLRARLDWENAMQLGQLQLSPYGDLYYAHGQQDAYNEHGGGLPANFAQQTESTSDARLGVQGSYPLGHSGFNLISLLETTHRFDDSAASSRGEVPGLFSFELPGEAYEQNWQRLGLGIEGQLGAGKASLMLNSTTQGEMPSSWLAAAYQLSF